MLEAKRLEIKEKMETLLETITSISDVVWNISHGYVFGEYGTNEHYKRDELISICKEILAEKAAVEPITEEI